MKRPTRWMGLFASLSLIAAIAVVRADEEKVPLKDVPKAVLDAVKAKFPKAEILGAEKEVEKGKTTFELELKDAGKTLSVSLKPDGTILEIETTIAVKDLPKKVSGAVVAKYPKGTIKSAEMVTVGEKTTYEVVVTLAGKEPRELVLDPDGKILEDEEEEKD
ncbi:MAG: hypothetical protein JWN86_47 [Planctomycetota bacterium]|nr:hypothetical protein [Planctomycetota bacterium]